MEFDRIDRLTEDELDYLLEGEAIELDALNEATALSR